MAEKTTRQPKGLPRPAELQSKETLSPEEVAVVLGIGRTTAYRLLADSEIPSFRIGRLRRIRRTDVEQYLEDRARAACNG